jgi:hypothetical protein
VYGGASSSDPQHVLDSSPPRRSSATIVASALPNTGKVAPQEISPVQATHAALTLSTFILMPSQSAPNWQGIAGRKSIDTPGWNWNEFGVELAIGTTHVGDLHLKSAQLGSL